MCKQYMDGLYEDMWGYLGASVLEVVGSIYDIKMSIFKDMTLHNLIIL